MTDCPGNWIKIELIFALSISIVIAVTSLSTPNCQSKRRRLNKRRDGVLRASLVDPKDSAIKHLLSAKEDSAYIKYFGIPRFYF